MFSAEFVVVVCLLCFFPKYKHFVVKNKNGFLNEKFAFAVFILLLFGWLIDLFCCQ
jgi:hypothetical protein